MEIPKYLKDQISEGSVVLFLGSGASVGALHPTNDNIPIGQKLSDLIAEKFLGEHFKNQPLQYIAELAISETDLYTVQKFISDIYRKYKPNKHHKIIPTFVWKSIVTTNYDLMIEDAYLSVSKAPQELAIFVKDGEKVRDKITSQKSLPFYKIHGCINHINDISLPLILTPEHFITHKENRERLFSRVLELGRDYTFLFVGFSFADYDIRLMLQELDKLKEGKPRSYMVGPHIKEEESRLWDKRKVTSIKCSFEEFLIELNKNVNSTLRILGTLKPVNDHPIYNKFVVNVNDLKPTENFQTFINNDIDFIHSALSSLSTDPKEFYKGYFENWDPILNNLDVKRSIIDGILSEVFLSDEYNLSISQNLFLIKGHAGSGKSVILKRLAWDAGVSFDKICLFYKPNVVLKYEFIAELYNFCKERIYIFLDNSFSNSDGIKLLLDKAKKDKIPLTIITAERINVWNSDCSELTKYLSQDFHVRYLNDKEIVGLIELLEKHNSLYTLKEKSLSERIEAFSERAGRELLVALYEATSGKPFTEIIKNEFNSITNSVARSLYLTVSILHRLGAESRAGFISRVHGIAFNEFKLKFFKPLEFIVFDRRDYKINDYVYLTRHKHIAEIVFEVILTNTQDRFDEYLRIIQNLDVDYESDRIAFMAMTNARKLLSIFNDPDMIRKLYAAAKERSKNDGKLFQQEAIFEMTSLGGNMKNAEIYLNEAFALLPGDPIISHSFAQFSLKKAEKSLHQVEFEKNLSDAEEICNKIIKKFKDNPHPYHTLLKILMLRFNTILESQDSPAIERMVKELEKNLSVAKQLFPEEQFILEAESNFNDLINNKPEALYLLKKAFDVNKSSPFIALRLANVYDFNKQYQEGIEILKEALNHTPGDKEINFKYATLLSKQINCNYIDVKHYLRRSFTMGDSRYQAQFWYARCLFLCNEISESREMFDILKDVKSDIKIKNEPRGKVRKDGKIVKFTGTISDCEHNYGFIKRDEIGDSIYFYRYHADYHNWESFKRNVRVNFIMSFNYRGAIALELKIINT